MAEWLKTRELRKENEGYFLKDRERRVLLSPKQDGLLLDGEKGRLDANDSFRNLAVVATTGTAVGTVPGAATQAATGGPRIVVRPRGQNAAASVRSAHSACSTLQESSAMKTKRARPCEVCTSVEYQGNGRFNAAI